ncbi:hypothetical protein DL98DRAFT_542991 [Cadophora sp. DSE1049]|nr:hypothetical protein DL98DRAFT_542991 [Cadophora sp. DSE1049]
MSVVGVTDWDRQAQSGEDLVMGKYSVSFLERVRQRFGSAFFYSDLIDKLHPTDTTNSAHRSMMPFTSGYAMGFMGASELTDTFDRQDHASLGSWAIQKDGSVRMRQAAIVASSEDCERAPINAAVVEFKENVFKLKLPLTSDIEAHKLAGIELRDWIRNRPEKTYAICTTFSETKSGWDCHGILLGNIGHPSEEIADHSRTPPQYFVKLGTVSCSLAT